MQQITKVAVIGAGTMGAGIASHVSNAGIPVVLLDVAAKSADERSSVAEKAVERLLASSPPAFMDRKNAELIAPGNVEDHMDWISDADWIAEAIVERLEVKHRLYQAIDAVRKPGSSVSSNTSTIPLQMLTAQMPDAFKRDFCITHFFNPVRYMRLLEIVAGPLTRAAMIEALTSFCDKVLGKGVVQCKDSPGFLGNRVGVYALQTAIVAAKQLGLEVEEADALMGRPMRIPKTGVFALYDLIGLDLMLDVAKSLATALPDNDGFQQVAGGIPLIPELTAKGYTGNKGLGGFYRRIHKNGASVREAIDLETGSYRPTTRPMLDAALAGEAEGLRALVEHQDKYGQFAWQVLSKTLAYAAALVPHTSAALIQIDEAMKLGYGWLSGPFEMIDELGVVWFRSRLEGAGIAVPPLLDAAGDGPLYRSFEGRLQHFSISGGYADIARAPGMLRLTDITKTSEPLARNEAASLWDVGDGVTCVEFHTKANALSPTSMALLREAIAITQRDFRAMLIHNDAPHFSVGFNLEFALDAARREAWQELDAALLAFQETCLSIKYAPFPVISAPAGMCVGGGYEVLVHSDALQAHANTVMGLVETVVGLIPSGGGCKEMLHRWTEGRATPTEALPGALRVFEIIGMGKTGTSPVESSRYRFFLSRDRSTMNRDRLLAEAKTRALQLARDYVRPTPPKFVALGNLGMDAMQAHLDSLEQKGITTPHDLVVGRHLARVLCGGDQQAGAQLSEPEICCLERESFIALAATQATLERIAHMLDTGSPLRN